MEQKEEEFSIEGMSCASCAQAIEKALKQLPSVSKVLINFATSKLFIQYDRNKLTTGDILEAVHHAGYHAEPSSTLYHTHQHNDNLPSKAFTDFLVAALLTLPLLLQMFGMLLDLPGHIPGWLELSLASIVQFWCGWRFYASAYHSLKAKSANMDVLIVLGTLAAYLFSVWVLVFDLNQPLYFESSATIITLILLGRWLESKSKAKASTAIEKLIRLQPKTARVQRGDQFVTLPIEQIEIGDLLMVRPGENVPIDGIVERGDTYINESLLTGENLPTHKLPGDSLYAGTTNQNGVIYVKVTRLGTETTLAGIVRLVQQAQNSKAPIQKLADQISAVFVPAVLLISLLTFLGTLFFGSAFSAALIHAVAVLIIACPCALGLATPTVILVASGRAAELGILFKEAAAIEQSQKIETIIFDKTGTLTIGKPSVQRVIANGKYKKEELLTIAAALEHNSQHPLAEAIVNHAKTLGIPIEPTTMVETFVGKGLAATKRGQRFYIGSLLFAQEKKQKINSQIVEELEKEGHTICVVWNDNELIGYLSIADTLRPHSKAAIQKLNQMHIYTAMMTGDSRQTAAAIAKDAGIQEFYAEVLPAQKAERVHQLASVGKTVAMVGDGINDAPALASASIGFSIGSGSDIAIEASDVTLIGNDLLGVVRAILISKTAFVKIKQNLFFAFIYNIVGIPLAALGFLNPIIAAAAMSLSSLCVVSNALLLKNWKPPV